MLNCIDHITMSSDLNMDLESKNPIFVEAQRNLMPIPPQNRNGSPNPQSSPSPTLPNSKRKAPMFPELFKAGGKKRKIAGGPVQPKNAVVTLNEYKTGLEYVLVEQRGPVHQPTFVIGVTVNGAQFLGLTLPCFQSEPLSRTVG